MVHIVERLREDKAAIEEVFERIRYSTNGSAEDRDTLYRVLARFFTALTAFEESVFYPALGETDAAAGEGLDLVISQAASEHQEILKLLRAITELEPTDTEFVRARNALEQVVRSHFEREADEIFPLAERVIGYDEAEEMTVRHDSMAWEAKAREQA